ncbi:hypothetical protein GCM10010915_09600 [Microbacterium faecale]|uniref:Uncharacterized protein n=1 Tax=Microbacterium faecale TaxID=1804630 RepID=A0A917DED0_9MICO|nr:glycosyltransferase family 2 protein [Microbacterium faecale]GGD31415.1 hypothetical protein GCM10010915_09600 [Microbacterium faecale]
MIAFITSLRHPDNAADYDHIEKLLRQSLRSIEAQSDDDHVTIIVGNQAPSFVLPPGAHFVEVNFPPPLPVNGLHADRSGFVMDKGTKIAIGLIAAREYSPHSVMIFDADDFVHRELAAFVNSRTASGGWYIERGWIYSARRNGYRAQERFNRTCGTSFVLPYAAYEVPEDLDVDATQQDLMSSFGEILPNILGAHRNALEWHAEQGRTVMPLPFRAGVYHVDTGENHSLKSLPGVIRPWNDRFGRAFAITPTRSSLSSILSCYSPRAFLHEVYRAVRRKLLPVVRSLRRNIVPETTDSEL